MKRKLAIVLCLIGVMGGCGVRIAGSVDTTPSLVGSEERLLATATESWEPEAVVPPRARVEKTGQTTSYGPRDDGKLRKGVAWPVPRFMDNANGTVRDNLTGLTWLKNANCTSFYTGDTTGRNDRDWNSALVAANKLKDGYCGLTDGSVAGIWRLPNVKELQSLVHSGFGFPAIPNTAGTGQWNEGDPFVSVQSTYYWSSTTYANAWLSDHARFVNFNTGHVNGDLKTWTHYVWPVR